MITIKNKQPDFGELSAQEWIATNGIGGYA